MNAKCIAVANQKGGVGKTTTSLSLGAALAARGHKVMIMDLDPHACASVHMRFYQEQLPFSVYDLFLPGDMTPEQVWEKIRYRGGELPFDFVPASVRLSELDNDLKNNPGKGRILAKFLTLVRGEYDYVVLDCPPHVSVLLVNALVAADLLVIPIQTDFLALHGSKLLFDSIRTLNKILQEPVRYMALATMYDQRAGACTRVLNLMRDKLKGRMFETVIHMDTKFREASAMGKTILQVYPGSRGALEYARLAEEMERLW